MTQLSVGLVSGTRLGRSGPVAGSARLMENQGLPLIEVAGAAMSQNHLVEAVSHWAVAGMGIRTTKNLGYILVVTSDASF